MEFGLFTAMVGVDIALWFPGSGALLARIESWFAKRKESLLSEKSNNENSTESLKLTRETKLDTDERVGFSIVGVRPDIQLEDEYIVILNAKKGSYFGEIEFADWRDKDNRKNFNISIKNAINGSEITEENDEYGKVLDILQIKSLDLGGNFFDDVVETVVEGEAKSKKNNIKEHLANLIAKIDDSEKREKLINNYYKKIKRGIENRLKNIDQEKRPEIEKLLVAKRDRKKFYIKWLIIGTVILAVAAVALAMVIIFWPAGIAAGIAAVVSFAGMVSTIAKYLAKIPWVKLLVIFGLPVGIVKASVENKIEKVKIVKEKLEELKEEEAIYRELDKEIDNKKSILEKVIQYMMELNGSEVEENSKDKISWAKGATIGFGKQKIEDLGIEIVSQFFTKFSLDPSFNPCWERLNLSFQDSGITEKGVQGFAKFLKISVANRLKIQEIDLRGNPIRVLGIKRMAESLDSNFTITNFKYDVKYSIDGEIEIVDEDTQVRIIKNLIINRYLQNDTLNIDQLTAGIYLGVMEREQLLQKAFVVSNGSIDILAGIKIAAVRKQKLQSNYSEKEKKTGVKEIMEKFIKSEKEFGEASEKNETYMQGKNSNDEKKVEDGTEAKKIGRLTV